MTATALLPLLLLAAAVAAGDTTNAPAWGTPRNGVAAAARIDEPWAIGGTMRFRAFLQNGRPEPLPLPARPAFFAYLMLVQDDHIWLTERLVWPDNAAFAWPVELGPGAALTLPPFDAAAVATVPFSPSMRLNGGYPQATETTTNPAPAAVPLADALVPGPVRLHVVACLSTQGVDGVTVRGQVMNAVVGVRNFDAQPQARRARVLAALDQRFRRDAFAAKDAHGTALSIGSPAFPMLAAIVRDAKAPDFARMWAITAIVDAGGAEAVPLVREGLVSPHGSVRSVVAYHGLKLNDAEFDRKLLDLACAGKEPRLTAWAVLGFLRYRRDIPADLLTAAAGSEDPAMRRSLVDTIAGANPNRSHIPVLQRLARDADPKIRAKAEAVLGKLGAAP